MITTPYVLQQKKALMGLEARMITTARSPNDYWSKEPKWLLATAESPNDYYRTNPDDNYSKTNIPYDDCNKCHNDDCSKKP